MKKLLILVALLMATMPAAALTMSSYANCGGELLILRAYDEDDNDVWERMEWSVEETVFVKVFYDNITGDARFAEVMGKVLSFVDLTTAYGTPCDLLKSLDLKAV